MNFDLSEDQLALRDGIRSLCRGRFTSERVRKGFDQAMFDELASTGVFSLRADGFGSADAAITFEELGRAAVPGPLVWTHLAHGVADGAVTGIERPASGAPAFVEHLAAVEHVIVLDDDAISLIPSEALGDAEPLGRGDDRGVDGAQRQVAVEADELGDPHQVGRLDRLEDQVAGGEVAEQADLAVVAASGREQMGDLGEAEGRDEQRPGVLAKQAQAGVVVLVDRIHVGQQRPGVD